MRTPLLALLLLAALPATPRAAEPLDQARSWLRAGRTEAAVAALSATLPDLRAQPRDEARYLLGRALVESGRPSGLTYLEALPTPWEPVEDRRRVWLARGLALTHRHAETLTALDAALAQATGERESTELRLLRADTLDRLGRPEEAQADLGRVASGSVRDLAAEARRRLVLRLRDSDPRTARRHALSLMTHYPDTRAAGDPALKLDPTKLSAAQRLRRAKSLMARFRHVEARELLRPLTTDRRLGDEARRLVGEIGLYKLRDAPQEARRMLLPLARGRGKGAEDAILGIIRTFLKEDRYPEALEWVARYGKRFPRGRYREAMAYYKGWLPYDQRRCDEALPHLRRYVRVFGERRSYMRGFVAWCAVRQGRWEDVLTDYEEMVSYGGSLTRGKAWYWQAVALDKLGRRDEAKAKLARLRADFPLTWYDVLGQQLLARWEGRDPRASRMPWPDGAGAALAAHPHEPEALTWPELSGRGGEVMERVRRLCAIGEVDLAREAYGPIRERAEAAVPGERRHAFIRAMGHAVEDYRRGWKLASGGRLGGMWPLEHTGSEEWLTGYPRAYRGLVERWGSEHGIPPLFVYAIMRQESRYTPAMVSAMEAVGALQMIPQTAELVAADMGVTYDPVTFPDPRTGFPYSTWYMARHDRLWHGQLVLTAASYNAGPEPVARWLRENPGADLATLVEEFSYNEARAYARMVASHLLRYLYLYETDVQRRGEILDRLFPVEVRYDVPAAVGY